MFSKLEIRDLLKSWVAISLAFTIADFGFNLGIGFIFGLVISGITVGLGFLLHELAHKFVAQHFGCRAEYRSFDNMLVLAIALSFLGFVFAAPGAVMISGNVSKSQMGKIAIAGPIANIILAIVFLGLLILGIPILDDFFRIGMIINSWLAIFNLLPFGNFDGLKVLSWNRVAYIAVLAVSGLLMVVQGILPI